MFNLKYNQVDANGGAGGNAGATGAGGSATGTVTPPAGSGGGAFYEGFKNIENKNFAITKGYADPEAAVESYRNFEKMKGVPQERLLTLPEKMDDAEGMKAVWERLGKPKDGKYSFEAKADATGKDTFGDFARTAFNEANLTDAQAKTVVEKYRSMVENITKTQTDTQTAEATRQVEALQTKWGNAFEQNRQIAETAATNLGVDKDTIANIEKVMGTEKTMELFKNIGSKMGEASFKAGEHKSAGNGKMSPDSAKAEIAAKSKDAAFRGKLAGRDSEALRVWEQLHKDASPGMHNL